MDLRISKIVILLYLTIVPIVTTVILRPYIKEDEGLYGVAAIVTTISLIIVPPMFFIQHYREKIAHEQEMENKKRIREQEIKNEKRSTDISLLGELRINLKAFDYDQYPNDHFTFIFNHKSIRVTNRFLNSSIYESILHTGKIALLDEEFRRLIQDIYSMIRDRDYYLKYASELNDRESIHAKDSALKYYLIVNRLDKKNASKIKEAIQKIESEYPVQV